jgi:hypothetical protein
LVLKLIYDYSDGKTPEEQTKQILAVAPFPGQKSTENNAIPPYNTSDFKLPTPITPITPPFSPSTTKPHPSTEENDLIDFGQIDNRTNSGPPAAHLPTDLKLAQTKHNGQQQKDLEDALSATSISPPPPTGALVDFHDDLKSTLKREDTDTKSVDEFVDAES